MKPGQRVVVALRKMIASGELRSGERIAEIATAEALGVSRMPVRTALRALEHEGLVVKLGARGYAARGVSAADVKSAVEVRGVLEGLAARQACEKGLSIRTRRVLRDCLAQGDELFSKSFSTDSDLDRYHDLNLTFHTAIVEAAGNLAVVEALARNSSLPFAGATALALDWNDKAGEFQHLSSAHQQHHAVFRALVRRDSEAAERLMRQHALAALDSKVFGLLDAPARTHLAVQRD